MQRLLRWIPWLTALSLGLGTALYVTNPAWRDSNRSLVCNWVDPDCLPNHWLLVWVAERLSAGESLLHNDRYYWPVGDAPFLAGNGGEGFLYLPFHVVFGWPGGVVWYALTVMTLNGLAAYALARQVGGGPWASLLGTGAVAFSPLLLHELSSGRFSQVSLFWLLGFLIAWLRLLETPTLRRAAGAAGLLAATSFFYWYYGLFGVIAGALLAGIAAIRQRQMRPGLPWPVFGAFCGLFLAIIGPWALIFARGWRQIPGTDEISTFPHPDTHASPWPPEWPFLIPEGHTAGLAMAAPLFFAGLLGAAVVGFPRRAGRARDTATVGLLVVCVVFYGLSLGPSFDFSPYHLVYRWAEPLRRFWWPTRHAAIWQPALAALGAVGLTWLAARLRRPWLELVLTVGLLWATPWSLLAQGVRIDVVVSSMNVPPPLYPALAQRPGEILLEPPLAPQTASARQQTIYQRWHHKTLLTGHAPWVDRVRPAAWDDFVAGNSFLAGLQALERGESDGTFRFRAEDLRSLIDQGLRHVSLNRELFPMELGQLVESERALFNALFGAPVDQTRGHWLWDTASWNQTTEVQIPVFTWPSGVEPGGPSQSIRGKRPASAVFGGRAGP